MLHGMAVACCVLRRANAANSVAWCGRAGLVSLAAALQEQAVRAGVRPEAGAKLRGDLQSTRQ